MPALTLRNALPADAARCYAIEITAYEGDEAATLEKIATRIALYPQGFLILEAEGEVVGFINGGCAHEVVMSDEAFKELVGHSAEAPNVVIMSVVVDPAHQGKGVFQGADDRVRAARCARWASARFDLMCKEQHVPLYTRMGYTYVRPFTLGSWRHGLA